MKTSLLFAIVTVSFFTLVKPSQRELRLLQHSIITQQTDQALELIGAGAADYAGPSRLHTARTVKPSQETIFEFPFLALATFCDQTLVVQALLDRGHSPFELIPCTQTRMDRKSSFMITTIQMATSFRKVALACLNAHVEKLALEERARPGQVRERKALRSLARAEEYDDQSAESQADESEFDEDAPMVV